MKRLFSLLVLVLTLPFFLTACGGGGGGGGAAPGPTPGPAKQNITISGTVSESPRLSGLVGGGAGIRKQQADTMGNLSVGAHVVIKSYDSSGNLIGTHETATTSAGGFNLGNIEIISTGGYITISASRDGFTTFEKTFTYKTVDDLKEGLQVLAEIDPVLTKVVDVSDKWNWTAALGDETISIAVMGDSRGHRQIVSGSGIKAAKASGSNVIWQIDLSRRLLEKQQVSSLKVDINNYDPSNPTDARRFPSDTDVNGNTLVSTGFDFIDIRDDKGNPLKLSSSAVGKAALPSYRVARRIPNCSLITCDEDSVKNGVQVGFYMVKNGKWNKLGEATLYASLNSDAEVFNLNDPCTDTTRPYAVVTEADLDFEYKWWNLDYPMGVTCDVIKEGCIAGIVNAVKQDSSKEPVKGLYLSLSNLTGTGTNFMGGTSYGYTKNDGSYKIEFSYSGSISDPTAELSYSDPFTWGWVNKSYTLSDSNKDKDGCYVQDIDIADPYGCEVKGRILKADGVTGAAGRWVNVYQKDTYYGSRWDETDSTGNYSTPVMCNTDYVLNAAGETKDFNVDGPSPIGDEKGDTGTIVEMKDISLQNHNPYAYAYAWSTSVSGGDVVQLYGYGYDTDGDILTYKWSDNCSGSFSSTNSQYPKWTAPNLDTTCTITLTVSDGLGGSDSETIYITVAEVNRPPVITSMIVPSSVRAGNTVQFGGYAYDPDGDTLTYNWNAGCGGSFDNSASTTPKWTAPGTGGSCTITFSVSDGTNNVLKSKDITVYANRAPVISSINAPSTVPKSKSVTIYSYAYDPDADPITYNWSATCGTLANSTSQNPKWTAPSTETTCDLTLTVTDSPGASDTETKSIQAVNTAPVITAFNVPDTAKVGDTVTLSATATDADGDTLTYTWYIQGTQAGLGSPYIWKPIEQGTYSVEVKVSDGVNVASQSKNVVVSGETSVDIIIQSIFKRR